MPPKKKTKLPQDVAPAETQPKAADKVESLPQSKKEEPKQENKPSIQPPAQITQTPLSRLEQPPVADQPQTITKLDEASDQKHQKIAIDDVSKLSEEEKLKLRKLRFGLLGTETTVEQAERIKQERLKKFGGPVEEDKETIERRKQKFGKNDNLSTVVSAISEGEDLQIVKRRLEKFGSVPAAPTSTVALTEDNSILEQRKKKFGNPEALVNLDQEIKKSKPIKKFHPKFNPQHGGKRHHNNNRNFRK